MRTLLSQAFEVVVAWIVLVAFDRSREPRWAPAARELTAPPRRDIIAGVSLTSRGGSC